MELRNLYRAALVTAALGMATVAGGCRTFGYEWKSDEKGLYLSKIETSGVDSTLEENGASNIEIGQPVEEPVPEPVDMRQRANEYRSRVVEEIGSYREGKQTAAELSENIKRIQADYVDVEQEIERRLQEAEPENSSEDHETPSEPNGSEQTYKTLDDLRKEYGLQHAASEFDGVGFLRYVDDERFAGRATNDVYSEAERYVQELSQPKPEPTEQSGVQGNRFKENFWDWPQGLLWLLDNTVGQLDRIRDGDRTHISEAYGSQPSEFRVIEAVVGINKAEEVLVKNNVLGSGKGLFGHKDFRNRPRHLPPAPEPQPPAGLFENAPKPPTEDDPEPSDDPFFGGGSAN